MVVRAGERELKVILAKAKAGFPPSMWHSFKMHCSWDCWSFRFLFSWTCHQHELLTATDLTSAAAIYFCDAPPVEGEETSQALKNCINAT
jgi:hypothetical protein